MSWKHYVLHICALAATVAFLAYHEASAGAGGDASVQFFRSGDTDTVLLRSARDSVILIDPSGAETVQHLGKQLPILHRTIDLLVLTHPNKERLSELSALLHRYTVRSVLLSGAPSEDPLFEQFLREVARRKIPVRLPEPARSIVIDELEIETVWPRSAVAAQTKGSARGRLVLRVHRGEQTILLAGAMRTTQAKDMLKAGIDLHADILHITYNTVNADFIRAVRPSLGILPSPITPYSIPARPFFELGVALQSTAQREGLRLRF